ncbi:hypothetical protein BDY19DRAFT_689245 [Irpex rosettiformis]|uniref:Uncharacterized protein n=1 Tax=Irpex rosettiformis TaxID=378272 RepID=A0ACB8UAD9_9APHY|nr:hypothetical protein BDY19DRAFT_689245 [Irpex rosettiformis]
MQLPPELRDCVIDFLQDSRPALQTCSLIGRAWLPRSRYHLFRSVQIEPGRRATAFRSLLDANPLLGNFVRNVEILGSGQDTPVEHVVRMEWPTLRPVPAVPTYPRLGHRRISWLENVLPESPKVLRRVSRLTVVAMHIHPELVDVLSVRFPAVKILELNKCRSATFAEFLALPNAFSEASCIQIHEMYCLRPTQPPAAMASRRRTLKTLILSPHTDVTLLLSWLVVEKVHTALESLSCHSSGQLSATAIRDLLKAVGPSLRHLSFGFSDVKDPTVILHSTELSLEPCTGLRSLHIHCANSIRFSSMPSLSWIILLLSKLNSPQLSRLEFFISASDICSFNLEGLAVVLAHKRCASLTRLVFHVSPRGDYIQGVERRIRDRLSSLALRGLDVDIVSAGQYSRLI